MEENQLDAPNLDSADKDTVNADQELLTKAPEGPELSDSGNLNSNPFNPDASGPVQQPDPLNPVPLKPRLSNSSQKSLKKQESPKKSIPVLNKDTCNSNTYDYTILFDTKVQKDALSGHRIKNSQTLQLPKAPKSSNSTLSKLSSSSACKMETTLSAKQQKLELLREEKLKNELKECTFAPKIKEIRKMRSPEEYYKDQMKFEEKKNEKLKNIQKVNSESEATQLSSYSFVPNITEKSSAMASKHLYESSTYDRLSKGSKPKRTKDSEETVEEKPKDDFTFTPNLNERSKNMLRMGPVEDILYEDAKRRQKAKNENRVVYVYESNVNSNSEKVLIEKFFKEFTQICDFDNLCFSDLNMILQGMHMMLGTEKHKSKEKDLAFKLWEKVTAGEESVTSERVLMHLMAIMKYQTSIYTDSIEAISPEETDTLHSVYFLFFENRNSVVNHSSFNRSAKPEPLPVFRPEISLNSKKILEDVSYEHILKRWEMRKMEVIQELDEKEIGECTFRPSIYSVGIQINSDDIKDPLFKEYAQMMGHANSHRAELLYSFASKEKEKKEDFIKSERDKQEEKELANCTFVPNSDKRKEEKIHPDDVKRCVARLTASKSRKNSRKLSKKSLKKANSNTEEKEKILREWEERKNKELKKMKSETELKKKLEKEKEEEKRRKLEEDKKVKYERLKKVIEEKKNKAEIDKKNNLRVKVVSVLGSEEDEVGSSPVSSDLTGSRTEII